MEETSLRGERCGLLDKFLRFYFKMIAAVVVVKSARGVLRGWLPLVQGHMPNFYNAQEPAAWNNNEKEAQQTQSRQCILHGVIALALLIQ